MKMMLRAGDDVVVIKGSMRGHTDRIHGFKGQRVLLDSLKVEVRRKDGRSLIRRRSVSMANVRPVDRSGRVVKKFSKFLYLKNVYRLVGLDGHLMGGDVESLIRVMRYTKVRGRSRGVEGGGESKENGPGKAGDKL